MLQKAIEKVITGQGGGQALKVALLCSSWLYKTGVKAKQVIDDTLWYKSPKVEVPVVCIGNIIAGGSGKTPLIQKLVGDLKGVARESIGVLSRGYKGSFSNERDVLCLNTEVKLTAKQCGDEAFMLYKNLPGCQVVVGKNRYRGAKYALCRGANLILLDDGMQNRTLFHDVKVAVLHADKLLGGQGLGEGFFLPRGLLRDFPSSLSKASYIVVNHVRDGAHIEEIEAKLKGLSSAPIVYTKMVQRGFYDDQGSLNLEKGARIGLFCGLGSPETFKESLAQEMDVAATLFLADHETPTDIALERFVAGAKTRGCSYVVCSEKDWVKLSRKEGYALPLAYVKSELDVVKGNDNYTNLLQSIEALVTERESI